LRWWPQKVQTDCLDSNDNTHARFQAHLLYSTLHEPSGADQKGTAELSGRLKFEYRLHDAERREIYPDRRDHNAGKNNASLQAEINQSKPPGAEDFAKRVTEILEVLKLGVLRYDLLDARNINSTQDQL
jgi:hypothetical protein